MPKPPAPNPPKIPELELIEKIGSGGYGEVWLCRNALGALRAVKMVRRAEFDDERPYEREFNGIRKFEPISRSHEGFVDLLQVGRNDAEGWFYYVMELADNAAVAADVRRLADLSDAADKKPSLLTSAATPNYTPRTLASEIRSRGALPLDECLAIGLQLASALAELHRHDLVHRDIKPSNIIFVGGAPKLADIGLVASASESRSFVGTEGFIPPEGPGTAQADIYSLGIVLYVMASGKHHRDFPEPPNDLAKRADREEFLELSAVIHRACQTAPGERYRNAAAFCDDIQRLRAGQSVKLRHWLKSTFSLAVKGAAALLIVGLGFKAVNNERKNWVQKKDDTRPAWERDGTTNVAAWEALMRGQKMASAYDPRGHSNAIVETELALKLDPNYCGAWASLASHYILSAGFVPPADAIARAQFCVEKALAIKPDNAGAIFLSGDCILATTYDFAQAEQRYRKAIALAPNFWALRNNLGFQLVYRGAFEEARVIAEELIREEPSLDSSHFIMARVHGGQGRFEEGLAAVDRSIRLMPDRPGPHMYRAELLWVMGRRDESARAFLRNAELNQWLTLDREQDLPALAEALRSGGPEAFLREIISKLHASTSRGFVSRFDLARFHAALGERDKALAFLEQAVDEHRTVTLGVKTLPIFRDYHDDPRFVDVLRRLRLTE